MCTFNDIPEVLDSMRETLRAMSLKMDEQSREIAELKAQVAIATAKDDGLIMGRFKRGEIIKMSDSRLWEGDGAPFKTRREVGRSRDNGCMWLTPSGQKSYRIKAEDLQDWLLCKGLRQMVGSR